MKTRDEKSTSFPTIKQMEEAVRCWWNAPECIYQQEDHTFKVTMYIPKPVWYGGSIDSVDFERDDIDVSFIGAYKIWHELMDPYISEPVSPCYGHGPEEFDLPF